MGFALPWASHNHIGWGAVVQEDCSSCFLAFFTWNILVIHLVAIAYLEGTWLAGRTCIYGFGLDWAGLRRKARDIFSLRSILTTLLLWMAETIVSSLHIHLVLSMRVNGTSCSNMLLIARRNI